MSGTPTVAGVDGCRGGWVAVVIADRDPARASLRTAPDFATLLDGTGPLAVVAVDIPIGLPERVEGKGRDCDVAARSRLGPRQSSVFRIPARAAVFEQDYRTACAVALATSDPPRKVARQAFNLFPRIREVDRLLRAEPDLAARVFECHPELAFRAMRGGHPADLPKKVKGRTSPAGLDERRSCLLAEGFRPEFLAPPAYPKGAGGDDLVDAAAAAWTAIRIADGRARCYPSPAPRDRFGLPMAIWA